MEQRIVDSAGVEVDEITENWVVYIALHLESERQFTDDDLLDDMLRALGYYRESEREMRQRPGDPHAISLTETLHRLTALGVTVADERRRPLALGEPTPLYRLSTAQISDIQRVSERIGSIWNDATGPGIDSMAELAWLVIVALRIHGRPLFRDDLLMKLESLWPASDSGVFRKVIERLDVIGLIDHKVSAGLFRRGFEPTPRSWVGLMELPSLIRSEFGNEPLQPTTQTRAAVADDVASRKRERRSNREPNIPIEDPDTALPELEDLAWHTLVVLREDSTTMPVREINGRVAEWFELPSDHPLRRRGNGASESPFEYRMRRARLILHFRAKALKIERPQGREEELDLHVCELLPRGRVLTRGQLTNFVRANEEQTEKPRARVNALPSIERLAEITLEVMASSEGTDLTVETINSKVSAALHLSTEQLGLRHIPGDPGSEAEFEYLSRGARRALRRQNRIVSTSDWPMTGHGPRESQLDTYRLSSLGDRQPEVSDTVQDEWQYDYEAWCWECLLAIRELHPNAVDGELPNGLISSATAQRFGLTPTQRDIRSLMNPMEREYTARCATIREVLALIGLIERGDKGPAWRLLPNGEAITRQELEKALRGSSFAYLPGTNGDYRGNPELEQAGKGTQPARAGATVESMSGHTNAKSVGEPDVQGDVAGHGSATEETDDLSLCLAVLQVLPDEEGEYLSEDQIKEAVAVKLQIPAAYLSQPNPPWGRKVARGESLLHFRLEHVYRALSIPQTALIRDGGLDFPDAGRTWFLTSKGREVVQTEDATERRETLRKLVNRYWSTHSYEGWQNEPWMERVIELLEEAGNDGTPFEHLCATLLERMRDVDVAEVQSSGYLDESGVDIVVKMAKGRTAMLGTVPIHSVQRDAVMLVQCKRWLHNDVPSDVVSKLFGFTARLRAQATGGELRYDVEGGRLIIFGNLTRDATWTYWWLREMWHQAEHTAMGDPSGVHSDELLTPNQRAPRWELWDGGRVLSMIRKYEVGVKKNADGEYVPDEEFFRGLPRGKTRRANA